MKLIELARSYSEIGEKWGHAAKEDLHLTVGAEISGLARFFIPTGWRYDTVFWYND